MNKFKQSVDYLKSGIDAAAVRGVTDHHFCVGRVTNIPTPPTFEKCHSVIILHLKKKKMIGNFRFMDVLRKYRVIRRIMRLESLKLHQRLAGG